MLNEWIWFAGVLLIAVGSFAAIRLFILRAYRRAKVSADQATRMLGVLLNVTISLSAIAAGLSYAWVWALFFCSLAWTTLRHRRTRDSWPNPPWF